MNIIVSWGYEINGPAYKKLLRELGVNYCAFMSVGEPIPNPFDKDIRHEEINIYQSLDFYKKNLDDALPLDSLLLEKMQKYEMMAMNIIYRWRRSITTENTFKEIKDIYYTYLRYWNDFIIKRKIDCLILFNLPHIHLYYIIYSLCKVHGIPVVVQIKMATMEGGLLNKYITTDIDGMDPEFFVRYEENKAKYLNADEKDINIAEGFREYFDEYKKDNNEIKRIIIEEPSLSIADKIKLYGGRAKLYISQERYRILFNKIIYLGKTKFLSDKILKYSETLEESPDLNKRFIFFPLHFQPEATTMPHAGFYVDQLLIIQLISACLPDGYLLYVKEHPAFWKLKERYECVSEVRTKSYYNSITKLQNVKLIEHNFSSLELIDNCECLVTCTGTASLEAVFKNKPVMLFGNMCYSHLPGSYKIQSMSDCRKALDDILGINRPVITKRDLKIFFKTLEPVSVTVGPNEGLIDIEGSMSLEESSLRTTNAIISFIKNYYPDILEK